jgi:hypothetical protein
VNESLPIRARGVLLWPMKKRYDIYIAWRSALYYLAILNETTVNPLQSGREANGP